MRVLDAPPLPRGIPPGASPATGSTSAPTGEWFFLGTLFTNFYRKAFEALGFADRLEDAGCSTCSPPARPCRRVFVQRPRDEWLQLLQANGVPCAPVGRREAWFAGDAVAEGGLRQTFSHPTLGEVAMPAPPAGFQRRRARKAPAATG